MNLECILVPTLFVTGDFGQVIAINAPWVIQQTWSKEGFLCDYKNLNHVVYASQIKTQTKNYQ